MEIVNRNPTRSVFAEVLLILFWILLGSACAAKENLDPRKITLVDLLATPQDFVGQTVSVVGYLAAHANLELFLTKEHADARDYVSSIVVGDYDDLPLRHSKCQGEMVEVTGVIIPGTARNFVIGNVSRIAILSTNASCWEYPDSD